MDLDLQEDCEDSTHFLYTLLPISPLIDILQYGAFVITNKLVLARYY